MSLDNSYKKSLLAVEGVIKRITAEMFSLNAQVTTLSRTLNTIGGKTSKSDVPLMLQKQKKASDDLNIANNKLIKSTKDLNVQKNALTKIQAQERVTVQALNKERRTEATSISKVAGAYSNLKAKQQLAKKTLQDLIVANGKNNVQVKKAQREYDKLTKKINITNKATSNFSKTGLGSMVRGFKNLLGAFGIIGGVMLFRDFTKAVFDNLKTLDKLDFSLRAVIKNEGELIQTRAFLNDITIRYGAELVSTTERYIKFATAARQSGVAMKDTEQIFETMTEAAGVMGLKTDELTGIYLALEQMLSKGKVTTEELRRQLGERLPGAFGIMANALGVTTIELDKMLRAGEVLSAEVLPKFAKEVEKAFGLDTIDKVTTLQASTTNLASSWQMLIEEMRTGSSWISTSLRGIIDGLGDSIRNLTSSMKGDEGIAELSRYNEVFRDLKDTYEKTNDPLGVMIELREKQNVVMEKHRVAESEFIKLKRWDIGLRNDETIAMEKTVGNLQGEYKAIESYIELLKSKARQEKIDKESVINKLVLKDKNLSLEKLEAMSLKELNELWLKLNNEKKKGRAIIEGTIAWYQKQISVLKDEQKYTSKTTKAYKEKQKAIGVLEEKIKDLIGTTEDLLDVFDGEGTKKGAQVIDDLVMGFDSWQRGAGKAKKSTEELKSELEDFFGEFQDEFASEAGFDFFNKMFGKGEVDEDGKFTSTFDKLREEAISTEKEFGFMFNTITEIGQEAFNFLQTSQDAYFDAQFARLEQQRDVSIMFAGESVSAQEEIERQYEERRKKIAREQAQAQKKVAMFNIAINTAQAIVATLGKTGFAGIPLSVIVGAMGAAQLAMVAATKVPEFFRGTDNAPEGWAKVDEQRPEIHTDRRGNIKSFGEDKANFRFLNAGDKIYSSREKYFNKELSGVLSGNDILPYSQMFNLSTPNVTVEQGLKKEDFIREIRSMKDAITNKESTSINIDKNGFAVRQTSNGTTTEQLNNVLRLKGTDV